MYADDIGHMGAVLACPHDSKRRNGREEVDVTPAAAADHCLQLPVPPGCQRIKYAVQECAFFLVFRVRFIEMNIDPDHDSKPPVTGKFYHMKAL